MIATVAAHFPARKSRSARSGRRRHQVAGPAVAAQQQLVAAERGRLEPHEERDHHVDPAGRVAADDPARVGEARDQHDPEQQHQPQTVGEREQRRQERRKPRKTVGDGDRRVEPHAPLCRLHLRFFKDRVEGHGPALEQFRARGKDGDDPVTDFA